MRRTTFAASAALALSCASAMAATPILKGTYNETLRHYCQPTLIEDSILIDNNSIKVVDQLDYSSSSFDNLLLTAVFSPTKGKVTLSGFVDSGTTQMLEFTGAGSGTTGVVLAESPFSMTAAYSMTATTITIGGETYNALYGAIDKNGVAHTLALQGMAATQDGTSQCSWQGEATLQ
jgi:hypothetical protein